MTIYSVFRNARNAQTLILHSPAYHMTKLDFIIPIVKISPFWHMVRRKRGFNRETPQCEAHNARRSTTVFFLFPMPLLSFETGMVC